MFTGIIEELGKVVKAERQDSNLQLTIKAQMAPELKIDQSVSHNGVCLTVIALNNQTYSVIAIEETLSRTNLKKLQPGDDVNLERGMRMNARLDGHIVQGHVDQIGICSDIVEKEGSYIFYFKYDRALSHVTISKGSITINGVSLTVVDSEEGAFSVAIIPYTFENTTFRNLNIGDEVNLEFDVIGKYVSRLINTHV